MRQKLQNELYLITLLTIPYSPPINELGRNTVTGISPKQLIYIAL